MGCQYLYDIEIMFDYVIETNINDDGYLIRAVMIDAMKNR